MRAGEYSARVWHIIAAIPPGRVASFGLLAALCGNPRMARRAARAVANAPDGLPCHRVVRFGGRLVPEEVFGPGEQRARLLAEGVTFRDNGCVDMGRHLWHMEEARSAISIISSD